MKTKEGDCWDMLSLRSYGTEKAADILMESNRQWIDVVVFDEGVEIERPTLETPMASQLPPWKL